MAEDPRERGGEGRGRGAKAETSLLKIKAGPGVIYLHTRDLVCARESKTKLIDG